ncbi:3-ketosteroid-delta-1-dehydrogenase [Burkholderiales bacterium]
MSTAPLAFDAEYDVVVVGSGAGGMLAALRAHDQGLKALLLEKAEVYGGTSAISGGGIWIPNNAHATRAGLKDTPEQARAYVQASVAGEVEQARIDAYLAVAPQMAEYLEQKTLVRYAVAAQYPDYYPELPGALAGGRTLDPELFDASVLGDELKRLRPPSPTTLLMGKIAWTARQAHKAMSKSFGWRFMVVWAMLKYRLDKRWRKKTGFKRDRYAALGSALVAGLRRSMMDRQIDLWLSCPLKALLQDDGKVIGVEVEHASVTKRIHARRGVILASGGFEQNQALREQYLPAPTQVKWSATPTGQNTGDALLAAQALGAKTSLMDWAWWCPTIGVPKESSQRGVFAERAFPGAIVVNGLGQRFANEAEPYLEFGKAMYDDHAKTGHSLPAWVIFDAHFRFHYAMGPIMPGQIMPDRRIPEEWWGRVLWTADSLDALAAKIGVDAQGLATTVERVNSFAKSGTDLDFGRGGNVYDRYYGDVNVKPNPCLAPVAKAPFYAMRMDGGDIGTKGGLLTNAHAQVIREDGSVIRGLYAIGNCSSSVMGKRYPGAGSTLGPAMTFGFIAADHLGQQA